MKTKYRGEKMDKILVASNNAHKIAEIKEILSDFHYEIISLREAGIDIDVLEDGTTFMENANKKAMEIYKYCKGRYMVLSDDSGLSVDVLDGAPGVYSARFAGEHGNDEKNNEKLLEMMKGIPNEKRKAKFVCAMVLIMNVERIIRVQGEVEGYISEGENGLNGFGYDPLFYIPSYGMTFAEMDSNSKNLISHRGKALKMLREKLSEL